MPTYRGPVTITGYITIEADSLQDADHAGENMTAEQIIRIIENPHVEVFEDETPKRVDDS